MVDPARVFRWDELELDRVTEMVARKVLRTGSHQMSQVYLKRGALVPRHAHAGEQLLYVLQGALRVQVGTDAWTVREGEVITVPPRSPHQAEALDDTFVISVHAPDVVGAG